jgi:biotin carboxyl carrier protein
MATPIVRPARTVTEGQTAPPPTVEQPERARPTVNEAAPTQTSAEARAARGTRVAKTSQGRRRLLLLTPILLIVLLASLTMGYRFWYDSTYFVMTDNALVTGDLIQVGSLNAGRVMLTRVDVGDEVRQGDEIAVVSVPQHVGSTPMGGTPRMDVTGSTDSLVSVQAPSPGIIAARRAFAGSTVAAGQPMFALIDPARLGVRANIEETKAARLQTGQPVEVHVDALDRTFDGWVDAISAASAATFSLLPAQNTSGNFTKVTQLIPVKIGVYTAGAVLRTDLGRLPGEVRRLARDPHPERAYRRAGALPGRAAPARDSAARRRPL